MSYPSSFFPPPRDKQLSSIEEFLRRDAERTQKIIDASQGLQDALQAGQAILANTFNLTAQDLEERRKEFIGSSDRKKPPNIMLPQDLLGSGQQKGLNPSEHKAGF